jgi:hypothetical protein
MKITSIDLELQAKTSTSWPEGLDSLARFLLGAHCGVGIGARRVDVQEDHKVFSESTVFFHAGPAPRRTASVGPGVDPWQDEDYLYDPPSRPETPRIDDPQPLRSARAARRVSADSSYFIHDSHEQEPSIPPYTPLPTPPSSSSHASPAQSSSHLTRVDEDPAHALEDFRNALRARSTHLLRHSGYHAHASQAPTATAPPAPCARLVRRYVMQTDPFRGDQVSTHLPK